MFHSSHQIARLKHSLEMNELVEETEEQAKEAKDPVDAMTIANELRKRHEWVMSPKSGKIAQHITSAAFVYQLGITPAAYEAVLPDYLWPFRPSGQYDAIKASAKNLRKA